jgi:hypothetical protein
VKFSQEDGKMKNGIFFSPLSFRSSQFSCDLSERCAFNRFWASPADGLRAWVAAVVTSSLTWVLAEVSPNVEKGPRY